MDLTSAQVIGAGLAAIGVGAAAIGVGNVFGSFLESALRNPAAADGQQGRLFIGFAAAELLGLIAFAVAMIILYAPLQRRNDRAAGTVDASDQPAPGDLLLPALLAAGGVRHHLLRDWPGNGAEDPVDGRRRARRRSPTISRPPSRRARRPRQTEEAYRERIDASRGEALPG